jgi:carbamoyltransferase
MKCFAIRVSTMCTLGINAVYHDSAAALIRDGVVIAAAEGLREAGIELADVDHVAYSYDPKLL